MFDKLGNPASDLLGVLLSRRRFGGAAMAAMGAVSLPTTIGAKKKKKKKKKPVCSPQAAAATCADQRCGPVANNCNQAVDCGPCATYAFATEFGGVGGGDGKLRDPRGVAVDNDGNVYVADTTNNRIQKFSKAGQYLDKWGARGSGVELSLPYSVAVDQQGNIFVADFGNDRIVKLDAAGNLVTAWDTAADAEDTLSGPRAVSVDASGTVYVSDFNNHRILVYSNTGGFQSEIDAFFVSPTGVASNGVLHVVDAFANRVYRFPGTTIGSGVAGSGDGQFAGPSSVAFSSDGGILVTDSQNDRFQIFDSDGDFIAAIQMPPVSGGGSSQPLGIAVDDDGNVYVANINNHTIQKFRPAAAAARAKSTAPSRAAPETQRAPNGTRKRHRRG